MFTPVLAKHSKSFSLIDCISVGVDRMQRNFEPMRKQVEAWQRRELTDVNAKVVIYEAFVEGNLEAPKHLARTVHDLYFLCGAEIYVALASDARKGTPFGVDKRHITFGSETAKELHNARVLAPHLSFVPFPTRVTGRQRLRFHLKIDFGVDIGGVDGNMSQPRPDRVDVYAST